MGRRGVEAGGSGVEAGGVVLRQGWGGGVLRQLRGEWC